MPAIDVPDAEGSGSGEDVSSAAGGVASTPPKHKKVKIATRACEVFGSSIQALDCSETIDQLQEEQQKLKKERDRVRKDLKNRQKGRQRLRQKAKQLSNEDLLAVMLLRTDGDASKLLPKATPGAAAEAPAEAGDAGQQPPSPPAPGAGGSASSSPSAAAPVPTPPSPEHDGGALRFLPCCPVALLP